MFTGLAQLDKNLISEINEYYLLHGTKPDLIELIAHDNVDFRMSSDKPMFGRGAYYAESSTKADQYAGNCEVTEWSQKWGHFFDALIVDTDLYIFGTDQKSIKHLKVRQI